MNLARALAAGRSLRVIGFDDAPFDRRRRGASVLVCGVVCAGTRFEGAVTTRVRKDGWNATSQVVAALRQSKFLDQVHLALFDGIAFGGFNVVDLPAVHAQLGIPTVAFMRNPPDMTAVQFAIGQLPRAKRRMEMIARAGEIHESDHGHFQVVGAEPDVAREALRRVTDVGHVPEALRIAHLIGSAVVTGQSGKRA